MGDGEAVAEGAQDDLPTAEAALKSAIRRVPVVSERPAVVVE